MLSARISWAYTVYKLESGNKRLTSAVHPRPKTIVFQSECSFLIINSIVYSFSWFSFYNFINLTTDNVDKKDKARNSCANNTVSQHISATWRQGQQGSCRRQNWRGFLFTTYCVAWCNHRCNRNRLIIQDCHMWIIVKLQFDPAWDKQS